MMVYKINKFLHFSQEPLALFELSRKFTERLELKNNNKIGDNMTIRLGNNKINKLNLISAVVLTFYRPMLGLLNSLIS